MNGLNLQSMQKNIYKNPIVLLSCVKSKNDKKSKAKDMYISALFKYSYMYASKITSQENIYILSAKYGLLKLDDEIYPYEDTLNTKTEKQKKIWAYKVYKQMKSLNFDFDKQTVFLCGNNYRKYLITKFSNAIAPLSGLGLGKQLQFYKQQAANK